MKGPPITILLSVLTIAFSFWGFNNSVIFDRYKFQVGAILHKKQWYRLISSGFLHGGLYHLAVNLLSFYFAGESLEPFYGLIYGKFGIPLYLLLYFGSMLGGSLLSLWENKGDYNYNAIGASGAVSGMLFAFVVLAPTSTIYLFFFLPMPMWLFAFLYVAYSLYGIRSGFARIGHGAHLGGALTGLILASFFTPKIALENWIWVLSAFLLMIIGILLIKKDSRFLIPQMSFLDNIFKPKKKNPFSRSTEFENASPRPKQQGLEINLRAVAQDELDKLLDKVGRKGEGSLSEKEKARLKELSDYLNRSQGPGGHRAPSE